MDFSQNLTALRKKVGLSQDNLAEQLHITRQAVSKWESGLSTPDIDTVMKLCSILGVTPNELLFGSDAAHVKKSDTKIITKDVSFIMTSFLCFLILVFGAALLTVNFFNGVIFEPQITLLALGLMAGSIIMFFCTVTRYRHRCKKE